MDRTEITHQLLGFLRPLDTVSFRPQGLFMLFYGFFGFALFGPIQWYWVIANPGYGLAQFNREKKIFTMIRDGEVQQDFPFDDIDKIKLRWSTLIIAPPSEIFLVMKDGREVHFMNLGQDLEKWLLERRAFQISELTGKKLDVSDFLQADTNAWS